MASAVGAPSASALPKPEVGEILLVIHDFNARSADELSLAKGDRVELIERDDEFGDGWYLGRHLVNDNTGLFPEVYTRPAPRNTMPTNVTNVASSTSTPLTPLHESASESDLPNAATTAVNTASIASPTPANPDPAPIPPTTSAMPEPTPAATHSLPSLTAKPVTTNLSSPLLGGSSSLEQTLARLNSNQDSHVINETLNVIDEHITDLRSPASNGGLRSATTDSGSEYSATIDHRMSYIQGEETDEEEDAAHTRPEVEAWSPDNVAEYLFTAGVEKHHCEVFRDQEISGEVLLGMDQSSLFIKALDLGSVGRRLKTWQKIKALQDEVNSGGTATRRTTQTYGSEVGSDSGAGRMRSRTNTITSMPKMPTIQDRPPSSTHSAGGRRSTNITPKLDPASLQAPVSPTTIMESPTRTAGGIHARRPSAADVRDLHHSRRHSSTDHRGTPVLGMGGTPTLPPSSTYSSAKADTSHKKQPSFDRNWTMGGAYQQRPLSSTGLQDIVSTTIVGADMRDDADRGYFSGTEVDGRRKNVLKKRESGQSPTVGATKTSYADEQRVRSATAISRHSRYGSIDSVREGAPSAAQKYYGMSASHKKTASNTTTESTRPVPPAKDFPSPAVTKLDSPSVGSGTPRGSPMAPGSSPAQARQGDWFSSVMNRPVKAAGLGLRAISDSVSSSSDRNKVASPTATVTTTNSSAKASPVLSPARTGSTTPSGGPSFDLDADGKSSGSFSATVTSGGAAANNKNARKKGKKETSAYTRGLQKISPREAMKGADYSGWMRKKSSNLMTIWKPRLFVLKGRRLAYYYSEDDEQEKGLIDISFHRVLPADNERLTGLHATITGAGGSTPSLDAEANGNPGSGDGGKEQLAKGDDAVFIFKLVPPRAGLSRAVNFTKPTVHYFAVPNLKQGRLWMAALMKATIDRDDTLPITSTYQQKTISLAKARAMRHRPPALMNLDEGTEEEDRDRQRRSGASRDSAAAASSLSAGANKSGATGMDSSGSLVGLAIGESDSGISGVGKLGLNFGGAGSARDTYEFGSSVTGEKGGSSVLPPQSA